jgi:hypothetical protein
MDSCELLGVSQVAAGEVELGREDGLRRTGGQDAVDDGVSVELTGTPLRPVSEGTAVG